jgi:hypothetical protein
MNENKMRMKNCSRWDSDPQSHAEEAHVWSIGPRKHLGIDHLSTIRIEFAHISHSSSARQSGFNRASTVFQICLNRASNTLQIRFKYASNLIQRVIGHFQIVPTYFHCLTTHSQDFVDDCEIYGNILFVRTNHRIQQIFDPLGRVSMKNYPKSLRSCCFLIL